MGVLLIEPVTNRITGNLQIALFTKILKTLDYFQNKFRNLASSVVTYRFTVYFGEPIHFVNIFRNAW